MKENFWTNIFLTSGACKQATPRAMMPDSKINFLYLRSEQATDNRG